MLAYSSKKCLDQSEASIQVTWSISTNQRPVLPGQGLWAPGFWRPLRSSCGGFPPDPGTISLPRTRTEPASGTLHWAASGRLRNQEHSFYSWQDSFKSYRSLGRIGISWRRRMSLCRHRTLCRTYWGIIISQKLTVDPCFCLVFADTEIHCFDERFRSQFFLFNWVTGVDSSQISRPVSDTRIEGATSRLLRSMSARRWWQLMCAAPEKKAA